MESSNIAQDAEVGIGVVIGSGTQVWGLAHLREHSQIGKDCIIGRGAYLGVGVKVGDRCKIQNGALIYEPAEIGVGVFIGPGAIFTNDLFPRAITPEGYLKGKNDWDSVGVVIGDGASVGAGAICVSPIRIGEWAMIAAGAVVTKDVAPYSLVRGIPAVHVGWVGKAGKKLLSDGEFLVCPETGELFEEKSGLLRVRSQ